MSNVESVKIEKGQWWTEKNHTDKRHRILVHGMAVGGRIICESMDGCVYGLPVDYMLRNKERLVDCDGWDWVPVVYPQYFETTVPDVYAYVRVDSPKLLSFIKHDGSVESSSAAMPSIAAVRKRVKLTEEQALARVLRHKTVAEPIPTLPTGPDHELMDASDVPDINSEHNYTDCNTGWRKSSGCVWFEPGRTVGWYRANKYYTIVFRRPKQKKTMKLSLTTFAYGDSLPPTFSSTTINPNDVEQIRKNWKYCIVLKTEEFEVPVVQK
jgi:hypothetical protein